MYKLLYLLLIPILLYSCSGNQDKNKAEKDRLLTQIKESEKVMYNDTLSDINVSVANNAIMLYSRFANSYHDDTSSAEYLFRAGELCKALKKGNMALEYYKKVENEYPSYPKMQLVIFMQGFVNENTLSDLEKAKYHYQRYIDKYPQSPMSKDLKAVIENMGKSDEELMKEFKLKENQKPS
jgi:outer membrane protein assembly factor BamD (BamD/ComL family)